MMKTRNELKIVFWGTSRFSVFVLNEMNRAKIFPSLIITAPPRKKGRGLSLQPSDVKKWADEHNIPTVEPEEIKSDSFMNSLGSNWDLFVIASYGKIVPQSILELPEFGTLNVHPSLLPKLRGASPIQSGVLEEVPPGSTHETGVTIMLIDDEVDHGPVVAQNKVIIPDWPPKGSELEETLGTLGGELLVKTIPLWIAGTIIPKEQNHENATFTKKMTSGSGQIYLNDDPIRMYRKIRAFDSWPRAYFITERNGKDMRVVVTEAHLDEGNLILDRVVPEGKREMSYEEFLRGQK
jgi:methionyl-tRNA formyltransferase